MEKKRKQHMLYVIGIIVLGFLILSILVSLFPDSLIDREFSEEIQEHHGPVLNAIMRVISWPGYMPRSLVMVVLTASVFYFSNFRREAFFILLTLLSGFVSAVIKIAVNRPRPAEPLVTILEKTQSQSFPSGHVILYVVFFGFLTVLMVHLTSVPKAIRIPVGIFSLLLIFSVAFSRMYLGAHWFTDVLGGFLSGLICLFILSRFYLKNVGDETRT